jgi:RNA-directed DNA polymerase
MKRTGNIYDQLCSPENVRNAAIEAMRHKKLTRQMRNFAKNFEQNCLALSRDLKNFSLPPCLYSEKIIHEPKERHILIAPFYWRVVHQTVVLQMKNIWNSSLINTTYACIPKRGIHKALRDVEKAAHNSKQPLYALKLDVKKYFDNVDHQVLKRVIERKLKDKRLLQLISLIIDSVPGGKGIPIGNLTSQYFSNLYLSQLDYYIKHELKIKHYFRYMDDMVVLHADKNALRDYLQSINAYLTDHLQLTLKGNHQIFPLAGRQLDFVGYRIDQHTTMMRKSILMRFYASARRLRKKYGEINIKTQLSSHYGWISHLPETHSLKIYNYAKAI